ncbi:MAG: RNA methyltransferase [Patescibacteria group bacterium]
MPKLNLDISSTDNLKVKLLRKLQRKKYRDELGLFVVENPLTIRDGMKLGAKIEELYLTPEFEERQEGLFSKIINNVPADKIYKVSKSVLGSCVSLEQPQGIIAVYAKADDEIDISKSVVFLHGVSDPGNVGALMRSCAAFSVRSIIADTESADFYNPKTVSAAKESIFSVLLARKKSDFLAKIKNSMHVYALDVRGKTPLQAVKWKKPFCLVLGNEAHGISDSLREYIDTFITITMEASKIESLNVAASGAIALHQIFLS